MSFFTRPELIDEQFKQVSGGTLTLNGETNFLGTLKSKNIEIDADATGALNGYVLTFDGIKISLAPSSGGTTVYNGASPSTITVGGIPSGTALSGRTFESLWEQLLVVFQEPLFNSFTISGIPTQSEVGDPNQWSGNFTFNWGTTNSTNVSANTISIIDITSGNIVLGNGLANDGSENLAITAVTNTSPISHQWRITGIDTQGTLFQRNYNINTIYPWFYGTVSSGGAIPGGNRPIANQALIDSGTKVVGSSTGTITVPTFSSTSDDYIWFATPETSTTKTVWFVDTLNNGSIGGTVGGANLFPDPDVVSVNSPTALWSSVNYKIYISNVQTSAGTMQFRNS